MHKLQTCASKGKFQPMKVSDLATKFLEIQLSTLKKDLQYLKQEQEIKMIGIGKGSIYISNDKK